MKNAGKDPASVLQALGVSEATFHRWQTDRFQAVIKRHFERDLPAMQQDHGRLMVVQHLGLNVKERGRIAEDSSDPEI